MPPILSRLDAVDGTASLRTIHRAATIVMTNMTGASKSSASLVPSRGTTHNMRKGQSTNPPQKTTAKKVMASFRIRIGFLKAAMLYFAVVFGVGFVLGP